MQSRSQGDVESILLSRPGWAEGWAGSAAGRELVTHWVGALIWNVLGIPVGWLALFGDEEMASVLSLLLPVFTLGAFSYWASPSGRPYAGGASFVSAWS